MNRLWWISYFSGTSKIVHIRWYAVAA
jgi:hypothetical protein